MIRKENLITALQGLIKSPYHPDVNTLNLCANLIQQMPDETQWLDARMNPPDAFVPVYVAIPGTNTPYVGYREFDGSWCVEGQKLNWGAVKSWMPKPKMPWE